MSQKAKNSFTKNMVSSANNKMTKKIKDSSLKNNSSPSKTRTPILKKKRGMYLHNSQ